MKYIKILIPLLLLIGISLILFKNESDVLGEQDIHYKIAVCPTYYWISENLEEYEYVFTSSTSESLELLKENKVDLVIAGRTLRSEEQFFNAVIDSQNRYSFLSKESISIYEDDYEKIQFFTDQDSKEIQKFFDIDNIQEVDDIYEYISEGIYITSWDNTDYTKANIVNVLDTNGNRIKRSRIPTIYYNSSNYDNLVLEIVNDLSLYSSSL